MVGLDQDMEMGRMVMEALGSFDQLQGRRHKGGLASMMMGGNFGMEAHMMGRGITMHMMTMNFRIGIQNMRKIMRRPMLKCTKRLTPHCMANVQLATLLPSCCS
jgi:hypothetical protein